MKASNLEIKHRVRRSVNPTNRIIALSEHGIRQVLFPYDLSSDLNYINFADNAELEELI